MPLLLIDNSEGGPLTSLLKEKLARAGVHFDVVTGGGEMMRDDWQHFYNAAILSGGPKILSDCQRCKEPTLSACRRDPALHANFRVLDNFSKPVLGICLGLQLMTLAYGGCLRRMPQRVQGWHTTDGGRKRFWFFNDTVSKMPTGFAVDDIWDGKVASMSDTNRLRFAVQYHPEKTSIVFPARGVKHYHPEKTEPVLPEILDPVLRFVTTFTE